MIVRNGTGRSGKYPTRTRVYESGPVSVRTGGIFPGPEDRSDPRGCWTTPRDRWSGKPGTPVKPGDYEPRYEYDR